MIIAGKDCDRLCSQTAMEGCPLLNRCKEGVFCLDRRGTIIYANPTACSVFSRSAGELAGTRLEGLLYSVCAKGRVESGSQLDLALMFQDDGEFANAKAYAALPGGKGCPIEYRIASVLSEDGSAGFVMTFRDIAEQLQTEERLAHLAHHDPLTDLPNRRLLSERLDYEIVRSRRHGEWFALHLIDLDDFKNVNDRYGHPLGDKLLVSLADRMRASVRLSDTVARVGGDEFAIIQVGVNEQEDAAVLARKLLFECSQPVHLNGFELFPAVTIGISFFAGDQTEEGLWAQADAALYQAKDRGKNTFVVVDEEITRSLQFDIRLVAALEHAIDYQQFHLVYQPQFCISSGALVGVEALLRWQHPEFGRVGPAVFIPVAEAKGFIHVIGNWVMTEACRQIALWVAAGVPFGRLAVNVSPMQLASPMHVQSLIDIVEEAGIPWPTLELEVTETAYFAATREVLQMLESMQQRGTRIAIDDFGTGYSSLLALRRMKANSLKIDRAFILDLNDAEAAGIVRETIALAHTLGMAAIAEGVEDAAQLKLLEQFGCDLSQGFYLGRPVRADELATHFFHVPTIRPTIQVDADASLLDDDALRWSADFETGIAQIDLQHQKLVDMVNGIDAAIRLHGGALPSKLSKQLEELVRYVEYHFRCEEAFMARNQVVELHTEAHCQEHFSVLQMLGRWIAACHAEHSILGEVRQEIATWLSRHILAEDKIMGEQIVSINRGLSPAEAYRQVMTAAALECR